MPRPAADAHRVQYESPPDAAFNQPRAAHFPLARSHSFTAALDRPCREHAADRGTACFTIPCDRGSVVALCGPRTRRARR